MLPMHTQPLVLITMTYQQLGPKWKYTPFVEKFQQNAPCLKLFKEMPLF